MPAVIFILETINSVRDVNGNTYWAFRLTHCPTGATIMGRVDGGESAATHILGVFEPGTRWENVHHYRTTVRKAAFRQLVKSWPHYTTPEAARAMMDAMAEACPTMVY